MLVINTLRGRMPTWTFPRLCLVCQTCNRAFAENEDVWSSILISNTFRSSHLAILTNWIWCHQTSITNLKVELGSPWLEALFVALQSSNCRQAMLNTFGPLDDTAVPLLSTFHTITQCVLEKPSQHWEDQTDHDDKILELYPLQALPNLAYLELAYGSFCGLEAAAHLTGLNLYNATAECTQDCKFVTSLKKVELTQSNILKFHEQGVTACPHLQTIICHESCIGAGDASAELSCCNFLEDDGLFSKFLKTPRDMRMLQGLVELHLGYSDSCSIVLDDPVLWEFDWLSQVPSFQVLNVTAQSASFPECLSVLTKLQTLKLDVADETDSDCPLGAGKSH